ncbi:phosphoglucosamine mutase [Kangiella sediminilitoris]|uniref:Phosphoglucosamine mutase n=1 Tax=Kangiella sediminilitoris TaxID=1144748 RepID=A0A1B3B857_9GAMM|nr:phosphoglucosamine mutase [Kangiella sediminilitoris]AOE48978.1 phosphoglucosamine mutase [Kangiella sediminilitoris]
MSERKYFGTDGIRGTVGEFPITPEFVLKLGWALGQVLGNSGKVVIGKDTRISGYMFESVLEAGLTAAGVDSLLVGPMPTPAVAYLTRTLRADAGIVISASHNPYHDNGIKFFSADGTKFPDEVELKIETLLDEEMQTLDSKNLGKAFRINDAPARYIEFCKASFPNDLSLKGQKVVVDCAHGATYHIAPFVFRELGADVIEIGNKPDGLNINLNCGATATGKLAEKVIAEKADLGIAFDGDGDRVMMVDSQGRLVNGDQLIWLLAKYLQNNDELKGGVAGTLMTNMAVQVDLEKMKVPFIRTNVGDRYVMQALKKHDWKLGGESSGHVICLDYNSTGDGIIAALQVLKAIDGMGFSLEQFVDEHPLFPQTLINVRVENAEKILSSDKLKKVIAEVESDLSDSGRVLIRKSGTEPLIRVMVEAEDESKAKNFAEKIANVVKA